MKDSLRNDLASLIAARLKPADKCGDRCHIGDVSSPAPGTLQVRLIDPAQNRSRYFTVRISEPWS